MTSRSRLGCEADGGEKGLMSESVRVETAAGHCVSCGERTCAAAEPATAAAGDSFSEREEREEEEGPDHGVERLYIPRAHGFPRGALSTVWVF